MFGLSLDSILTGICLPLIDPERLALLAGVGADSESVSDRNLARFCRDLLAR